MTRTKSQSRPGKSSHAKAYAAREATTMGSTVPPMAIQAVVHRDPVMSWLSKMAW